MLSLFTLNSHQHCCSCSRQLFCTKALKTHSLLPAKDKIAKLSCIGAKRCLRYFLDVSAFVGRKQPPDCTEPWATSCGAAGPAGPVQTGVSGGADPSAGLEGGAGRFRHTTARPTETVGPLEPAGHTNRSTANTGIHSNTHTHFTCGMRQF